MPDGDEIDLGQKMWTVPPVQLESRKKQPNKPHVVPLAPRRSSLLNRVIPNLSLLRPDPAGQWSVTRWPI